MPVKICTTLLCCLLFLVDGCQSKDGGGLKSTTANTQSSSSASKTEEVVKAGLDACRLIERSEVESTQGAEVREMIPSSRNENALAISQCYYSVFSSDGSKNLSVHVEVIQNDPTSSNQNAVSDLWRERFQGAKDTKKSEAPKSISGTGEGAYWVGNNKMGALYALKKDKLVRISVGGPDDEGIKIQKTKALAAKALKRLS